MARALTVPLKRLIYHHLVVLRRSAEDVLAALFFGDPTQCSLDHLKRIASMCRRNSAAALIWRENEALRRGRPRKLRPADARVVLQLLEVKRTRYLRKLRDIVNRDRFGDEAAAEGVSLSTIRRTLLRLNQTRKVVERRHMQLCDADRLRMYMRIQHVPVPLITDTDEMSARPNQFFARLGWAERGRDAIYRQIAIAGHNYSVLATYTPFGWLCWKVFVDETINSAKFVDYMENTLQPLLRAGAYGLLDNARIHKTPEALASIEIVFDGKYVFSAPYANMDKPVELGFANVKLFLRDHEDEAVVQPLHWINQAFLKYSIHGDSGLVAYNHFASYTRNHEYYLNNL